MELFGDVLYNLYGSTEVAVATVATPEDWKKAPGTVGAARSAAPCASTTRTASAITEPDTSAGSSSAAG